MSLSPGSFDRFWAAEDDPWGIEDGWYEERKRAVVLAALPEQRFGRAFEPGCAGGMLSRGLAARCDELRCRDVAGEAVARAQARLRSWPGVDVEHADVRDPWPAGPFDLVVVSELAYYFDRADRDALWSAAQEALRPGGTLVAVHWRRAAPGYPVLGDAVHDELVARPAFERVAVHVEADFRLDVLARVPPVARSVAERTGLR